MSSYGIFIENVYFLAKNRMFRRRLHELLRYFHQKRALLDKNRMFQRRSLGSMSSHGVFIKNVHFPAKNRMFRRRSLGSMSSHGVFIKNVHFPAKLIQW
jgi:hypothetical protein